MTTLNTIAIIVRADASSRVKCSSSPLYTMPVFFFFRHCFSVPLVHYENNTLAVSCVGLLGGETNIYCMHRKCIQSIIFMVATMFECRHSGSCGLHAICSVPKQNFTSPHSKWMKKKQNASVAYAQSQTHTNVRVCASISRLFEMRNFFFLPKEKAIVQRLQTRQQQLLRTDRTNEKAISKLFFFYLWETFH